MLKKSLLAFAALLALLAVLIGFWWARTAPPDHLKIGPPYVIGPVAPEILAVKAEGDPIGDTIETDGPAVRGYDDVVLQAERGKAYVTAMDGWIWEVDLASGEAVRFVDVPLMAAGAKQIPGDPDAIAFCSSFLHGETYPPDEQVGLYKLSVSTKQVTPLALRVPLEPPITPPPAGNEGSVYTPGTSTRLAFDAMDDTNSRPIAFCNDFDVTSDGERFYFSEPFAYEGASMGGGAIGEAITLGRNGRLWNVDTATRSAALVAQDYNFIDGVLLEESGGVEQSVLVTETTKFRLLRLHLKGEMAGRDEIVWDALPGMPDGLDRDADGNVWIGMLKQRSPLITWVHANPWIKPLMLRLPEDRLPVSLETSVLALSPDASTPLWYAEHDGSKITDIGVVIPTELGVYLANFSGLTPGVHRIPNPLE